MNTISEIKKFYNYEKPEYKQEIPKKTLKINFIIYDLPYFCKKDGSILNELNIMIYLTEYYQIYYNSTIINPYVYDNNFDHNSYNQKQTEKIKTRKQSDFYINTQILKTKEKDYDLHIFRCDNSYTLKKLFYSLPEPKIFSHNYDENIWKNNIIGFQTHVAKYLAEQQLLYMFKDDDTLNYTNKSMIKPKYSFVKSNFIVDTDNIPKIDVHLKYNVDICIGIIGVLNQFTNLNTVLTVFQNLKQEYSNKIFKIIVLTTNILMDTSKEDIIYLNLPQKDYYGYLKDMDVVINTYNIDVVIYSSSNKILDCISTNVPIIVPHSISYYDILGKAYPYYYNKDNAQQTILKYIKRIIENPKYSYGNLKQKYNTWSYNNYIHQLNLLS